MTCINGGEAARLASMPIPAPFASYLQKRGTNPPWQLDMVPEGRYDAAIVIPSRAEAVDLPLTLQSLSRNPPHLLERTLILVVVNQRSDVAESETADNQTTLEQLPHWKEQLGLTNLCWVDAASPGRKLPLKQGVGLARKIGMDLALTSLDYRSDPLLICLDADTIVQPDYLPALSHHFATTTAGGCSIPYRHRAAADPAGQQAIDRYELFLRSYILGLELAGSPYAFHSVGSAMACRASAYVAAGGMNRRLAGEDFYFLQQLHKTSGVTALSGTVVHPSPRASERVPFGTGRSVGDMLIQGKQRVLFYQPVVFSVVGQWLAEMARHGGADATELLALATGISPVLRDVLEQAGFATSWENLRRNNRHPARLAGEFHNWFDGFRTMRLIHELSDRLYPRIEPEEAVAPLLERVGINGCTTCGEQLAALRNRQGAEN